MMLPAVFTVYYNSDTCFSLQISTSNSLHLGALDCYMLHDWNMLNLRLRFRNIFVTPFGLIDFRYSILFFNFEMYIIPIFVFCMN